MPYRLRITEEEVREELERLGYPDLSDESVKAFRKDLLKLIKNDLRKLKRERNEANETEGNTSYLEMPSVLGEPHTLNDGKFRPRYSSLPDFPQPCYGPRVSKEQASKRYDDGFKEGMRSRIDDTTDESGYSGYESSSSGLESSRPLDSPSEEIQKVSRKKSTRGTADRNQKLPKEQMPPTCGAVRERVTRNESRQSVSSADSHKYQESVAMSHKSRRAASPKGRPGSSDIRRRKSAPAVQKSQKSKSLLPSYPSRNDPVSLYHYYKAHWEKFKVPGEDPRRKLRWDIRSMLFYSS